MKDRIHFVVDPADKERFRQQAAREGKTLSTWLREAAMEKLTKEGNPDLDSVEELRAFFADCDRREQGTEPDWEEHRKVIERSMSSEGTES